MRSIKGSQCDIIPPVSIFPKTFVSCIEIHVPFIEIPRRCNIVRNATNINIDVPSIRLFRCVCEVTMPDKVTTEAGICSDERESPCE